MLNNEYIIKKIIAEEMNMEVDEIDFNLSLKNDIDVDSLDFLLIVVTIEDELNIELSNDIKNTTYNTGQEFIDYVLTLVAKEKML